jgi:hypothetical protein
MEAYQPSGLVNSVVALAFYIIMAFFFLYSLISIYALLRYARSKILGIIIAVIYLIIIGSLYTVAVQNLKVIG